MRVLLCLLFLLILPAPGHAQDIKLVAAGSLREAFEAMISQYGQSHPVHVNTTWGPSGVLRDSLAKGEAFDIFASAALPHAQSLSDQGISGPSVLFVRNALCALVPAASKVTSETLVDFLLRPETRLATSTPKSDPGGDYTWQLFELIERTHAGAYAALSGKAQQIFGGPATTTAVNGRHRLSLVLEDGLADIVIYYCSAAHQLTTQGTINTRMLSLPLNLAVGPEYGLTISTKAAPAATDFALFMLSAKGQKVLKDFGFIPVTLPAGD
jgi:molybdenum ABC transporter molybdate-binding protein